MKSENYPVEKIPIRELLEFGYGIDGNFNGFYIQPKLMKIAFIQS
jgi:hypothetical protein